MDWGQRFLLTALRMNKLFQTQSDDFFLDAYFGTDELVTLVEQEELKSVLEMNREVASLKDSLDEQGFSAPRKSFIEKQLDGLEVMLKWFTDEPVPFEEEVQKLFGVNLEWISDDYYEQGLELFNRSLPGEGSLQERFALWQKRNTQQIPHQTLYPIIEGATAEAQKRTHQLFSLPEGENV